MGDGTCSCHLMEKPKKLVLATGNQGKLIELSRCLEDIDIEVESKPGCLEIEETGKTFMENAILKARNVAVYTGQWAMADDSGLCVDCLGGKPGVESARYESTDERRIIRLLKEIADSGHQGQGRTSAVFITALALSNPEGVIVAEAIGQCNGFISEKARGNGGFGYDPIFIACGTNKTLGELTKEEKDTIGHRGKALSIMKKNIMELIKNRAH